MAKKQKKIDRILTSAEVRDINECLDLCGCECHTPGISIMSHFVECCDMCYIHKVEIGQKTSMSEEDVRNMVNKFIFYNKEKMQKTEHEKRIDAWKRAISNTKLSCSNVEPTDEMLDAYKRFINLEIELDECVNIMLESLDNQTQN